MEIKRKTNHKTGWHKRIKNPTTNAMTLTHKEFCRQCLDYNLACPENKRGTKPVDYCTI